MLWYVEFWVFASQQQSILMCNMGHCHRWYRSVVHIQQRLISASQWQLRLSLMRAFWCNLPRWRLPDYTTPAHVLQMEITLLHQTGPCSFTPDGDCLITPPPAHLPQMEITQLHQTGPLLNNSRWRLPYYTTPAHLCEMEITLLHHPCSFTPHGDYPTTPDRPPANQPQMEIALLHQYALESSSSFTTLKDQQSGLDMERWLTPWRPSTYERPFTQEGNYLVIVCKTKLLV